MTNKKLSPAWQEIFVVCYIGRTGESSVGSPRLLYNNFWERDSYWINVLGLEYHEEQLSQETRNRKYNIIA